MIFRLISSWIYKIIAGYYEGRIAQSHGEMADFLEGDDSGREGNARSGFHNRKPTNCIHCSFYRPFYRHSDLFNGHFVFQLVLDLFLINIILLPSHE